MTPQELPERDDATRAAFSDMMSQHMKHDKEVAEFMVAMPDELAQHDTVESVSALLYSLGFNRVDSRALDFVDGNGTVLRITYTTTHTIGRKKRFATIHLQINNGPALHISPAQLQPLTAWLELRATQGKLFQQGDTP